MLSLPPDVVRYIARNGEDNDCAIAAISIASGVSYEEVLAQAMTVRKNVLTAGLYVTQIRKVLTQLGYASKVRKTFDKEKDTGLVVIEDNKTERHIVYLWVGRVVEPSNGRRSLWLDLDAYLLHEKSKTVSLITLEKQHV